MLCATSTGSTKLTYFALRNSFSVPFSDTVCSVSSVVISITMSLVQPTMSVMALSCFLAIHWAVASRTTCRKVPEAAF